MGGQESRRLGNSHSMEVDGAKDQRRVTISGVLEMNPSLQRPEIVPQVRDACWLNTREDDFPRGFWNGAR
jgi:hypothetical protein